MIPILGQVGPDNMLRFFMDTATIALGRFEECFAHVCREIGQRQIFVGFLWIFQTAH